MKLRPYQLNAVRKLPGLLKRHRRVLAVSPTGSGKTVIGAALIRKLKGKRVLWVAHRIELLRQARKELVAAGIPERDVGILSGVESENELARVLVASVDMLRSRKAPRVDLIVLDEAHRAKAASYLKIMASQPKAPVLGLTATPWRLDGQQLKDVFTETFVVATPTELIAEGHIAHPVTYGIPLDKARAIVGGARGGGGKDYVTSKLSVSMMRGALMGDIVSEWLRLAEGQPTIVFAVSREHAAALAHRFTEAKRRVGYLDGDTAADARADMLDRLKSGDIEIVVNVDVLSEGFDCPSVKCVVLARPTQSLTRYLQQTGRASRSYLRTRPIILDHAGNTWRFGLPESEQSWDSDAKSQGTGLAPVRECPECAHVMAAGCRLCPECGVELPRTDREISESLAELERLAIDDGVKSGMRAVLTRLANERAAPSDWVDWAMDRIMREAS